MSLLLVSGSRTQLELTGSICEIVSEFSLRGDFMTRKEDSLPIPLLERALQMVFNEFDSKPELIGTLCKGIGGIFFSSRQETRKFCGYFLVST